MGCRQEVKTVMVGGTGVEAWAVHVNMSTGTSLTEKVRSHRLTWAPTCTRPPKHPLQFLLVPCQGS